MYQSNPLNEAVFVKNTSGRVFHKGQLKQASYALKQTRGLKSSLELRLSKINDSISLLEKELSIGPSRDIQSKLKSLTLKRNNLLKMINLQDSIISNQQAKIQRMTLTNKKAGATLR